MNQNELYYQMIYKRKSFHLFRDTKNEQITPEELDSITETYQAFTPLILGIQTAIRIVPAEETTCKRASPLATATPSLGRYTAVKTS